MHVALKGADTFEAFLRDLLKCVHVSSEGDFGAVFSIAYAKLPEMEPHFLTGRCMFEHPRVELRRHEYPDLILDEWWMPTSEAVQAVAEAVSAKTGSLNGLPIPELYTPSAQRRIGERPSMTGWPEWLFELRAKRQTNYSATSDPVVRPGYRPYSSGNQAILDWVWRAPTKDTSRRAYENVLMVIVPDYRSRITSAEWRGQAVTVEVGGTETNLELQVLVLAEGTHRPLTPVQIGGGTAAPKVFDVPVGTERVEIFLVRPDSDLADHVMLHTAGEEFEAAAGEPTPEERAVQDLRSGENQTVEFKEFISPAAPKEEEIIRTIVAFANTEGGRLYLGVRDGGTLEGEAALCRAARGDVTTGWKQLADRVRHLVREKVKPVPDITILQIRVHGEPVVVVNVPASDAGPYATHGNDVFIRKGASSRKPDPRTELPQIGRGARGAQRISDVLRGL